MPLIFVAGTLWAAGTALGLLAPAAGLLAILSAIIALAWLGWLAFRHDARAASTSRRVERASLALLFAAALSFGRDLQLRDAQCLEDAREATRWRLHLLGDAQPGGFVIAEMREHGCRSRVAPSAVGTEKPRTTTR